MQNARPRISHSPKRSLFSVKLNRKKKLKYMPVSLMYMYHVLIIITSNCSTSEKSHGMWITQDIFLMPIMARNLMVSISISDKIISYLHLRVWNLGCIYYFI